MSVLPTSLCDPATLAAEVRDLATEAYRTLNDPVAGSPHTRHLSERISHLQSQVRELAAADLSLWLENLQRRVESRTDDQVRGAVASPTLRSRPS